MVRDGVLFQCSLEEAEELRIGMAGFTSYTETMSVYGTERSFIDGDDTPWSKAFLAAAYASRGIKMRCTSGAGAELLMGFHEGKSMLYLEARCVCLQRAMGVQGTQNGGIDGAPLTSSVPGGVRELLAENVLAVCSTSNAPRATYARSTESEIRVGAKIMPFLMSGTDFICSGFGSIPKYDNSFNASLFNAEEMEDFLALQREFQVEGGLPPCPKTARWTAPPRPRGDLCCAGDIDLEPDGCHEEERADRPGSDETASYLPREVARHLGGDQGAQHHLCRCDPGAGSADFARRREPACARQVRVSGDYLQTAAIVRDGRVISAVNDPNRLSWTGHGLPHVRGAPQEINAIRDVLDRETVLAQEEEFALPRCAGYRASRDGAGRRSARRRVKW